MMKTLFATILSILSMAAMAQDIQPAPGCEAGYVGIRSDTLGYNFVLTLQGGPLGGRQVVQEAVGCEIIGPGEAQYVRHTFTGGVMKLQCLIDGKAFAAEGNYRRFDGIFSQLDIGAGIYVLCD